MNALKDGPRRPTALRRQQQKCFSAAMATTSTTHSMKKLAAMKTANVSLAYINEASLKKPGFFVKFVSYLTSASIVAVLGVCHLKRLK